MAVPEYPPNSRLFILCAPTLTDGDIRKEFERFGRVEDCWTVNDKQTKKPKGICYIKFSKASEACHAIEEMDNKPIANEPRPIKVKMAHPVGAGNRHESDSECFERLRCAFIRVPVKAGSDGNQYTEESIRNIFEQFGTVVNCTITRSKRNCYVTFEKPSQAARAIEEADREFAAVFVDPEKSSLLRKRGPESSHEFGRGRSPSPPHSRRRPLVDSLPTPSHSSHSYSRNAPRFVDPLESSSARYPNEFIGNNGYADAAPPRTMNLKDTMVSSMFNDYSLPIANNPNRCREIYVKINYALSREHAFRLCNLVPGLEALELVKTVGDNAQLHSIFFVRYATSPAAAWAWEKLQDLEYPPGAYIRVRYADTGFPRDWDLGGPPVPASGSFLGSSSQSPSMSGQAEFSRICSLDQKPIISNPASSILSSLVDTLSAAAAVSSTASASATTPKSYDFGSVDCSVKLSYPKAMLPKSTPYDARLFFLCTKPISNSVLEDAFSSFGDLINVYCISGKNCGYVMYASKRAAEAASATLNNAVLAGSKLKILQADPEPSYKRRNTDESA